MQGVYWLIHPGKGEDGASLNNKFVLETWKLNDFFTSIKTVYSSKQ